MDGSQLRAVSWTDIDPAERCRILDNGLVRPASETVRVHIKDDLQTIIPSSLRPETWIDVYIVHTAQGPDPRTYLAMSESLVPNEIRAKCTSLLESDDTPVPLDQCTLVFHSPDAVGAVLRGLGEEGRAKVRSIELFLRDDVRPRRFYEDEEDDPWDNAVRSIAGLPALKWLSVAYGETRRLWANWRDETGFHTYGAAREWRFRWLYELSRVRGLDSFEFRICSYDFQPTYRRYNAVDMASWLLSWEKRTKIPRWRNDRLQDYVRRVEWLEKNEKDLQLKQRLAHKLKKKPSLQPSLGTIVQTFLEPLVLKGVTFQDLIKARRSKIWKKRQGESSERPEMQDNDDSSSAFGDFYDSDES